MTFNPDPYLVLVETLTKLIPRRKTKRKEYFEKFIEPLYQEFVPLGKDILLQFRAARNSLKGKKKNRDVQFEAIRARREEFSEARHQLRALLEACKNHLERRKDKELAEFVEAMAAFFNPRITRFGSAYSSAGESLVRFFHDRVEDRIRQRSLSPMLSDKELEQTISRVTSELERSWFEISGRFMAIKLERTAK